MKKKSDLDVAKDDGCYPEVIYRGSALIAAVDYGGRKSLKARELIRKLTGTALLTRANIASIKVAIASFCIMS
jgi:hypothetical protein